MGFVYRLLKWIDINPKYHRLVGLAPQSEGSDVSLNSVYLQQIEPPCAHLSLVKHKQTDGFSIVLTKCPGSRENDIQ